MSFNDADANARISQRFRLLYKMSYDCAVRQLDNGTFSTSTKIVETFDENSVNPPLVMQGYVCIAHRVPGRYATSPYETRPAPPYTPAYHATAAPSFPAAQPTSVPPSTTASDATTTPQPSVAPQATTTPQPSFAPQATTTPPPTVVPQATTAPPSTVTSGNSSTPAASTLFTFGATGGPNQSTFNPAKASIVPPFTFTPPTKAPTMPSPPSGPWKSSPDFPWKFPSTSSVSGSSPSTSSPAPHTDGQRGTQAIPNDHEHYLPGPASSKVRFASPQAPGTRTLKTLDATELLDKFSAYLDKNGTATPNFKKGKSRHISADD
ncbi:hypothetical protein BDN70DRAFT_939043 [Pholiota conissans]|uniref:Uncharacterized protein n=1 Tax=Pholiota conissans TaxID=109636 RepID=A0A9P6CRN5_9AGAR|nr:hypothetical protein BDN70DRAFT_939043 [Pholiota conissans]